jgi:hypothetical protein
VTRVESPRQGAIGTAHVVGHSITPIIEVAIVWGRWEIEEVEKRYFGFEDCRKCHEGMGSHGRYWSHLLRHETKARKRTVIAMTCPKESRPSRRRIPSAVRRESAWLVGLLAVVLVLYLVARSPAAEPGKPSGESARPCERFPWKSIEHISTNIAPDSPPEDCAETSGFFSEEVPVAYVSPEYCGKPPAAFYRRTSSFCHHPLYFEEVNLERYGYSFGILQPAASAVHFFGTIPALPYKMAVRPPCSCRSTCRYPEPGRHVPPQCTCPPLRLDAGIVEAGVVAGMVLLIP